MKPLAECAPCFLEWIFGRVVSSLGENESAELMSTLLGVLHHEFKVNQNLGLIAKRTLDAVNPQILAAAVFYNEIKKTVITP